MLICDKTENKTEDRRQPEPDLRCFSL